MFGIRGLKKDVKYLMKEVDELNNAANMFNRELKRMKQTSTSRIHRLSTMIEQVESSILEDVDKILEDTIETMAEWVKPPMYAIGDNINGKIVVDRSAELEEKNSISQIRWYYKCDGIEELIPEEKMMK